MTKSYESYLVAATARNIEARVRESRHNDAVYHCIPISLEGSIKEDYTARKYITPAAMALILGCDNDFQAFYNALEKHKIAIGKLILYGNYGNCNYEVHAGDHVYLQGWINFLGLPCFADSREAKRVVDILEHHLAA